MADIAERKAARQAGASEDSAKELVAELVGEPDQFVSNSAHPDANPTNSHGRSIIKVTACATRANLPPVELPH